MLKRAAGAGEHRRRRRGGGHSHRQAGGQAARQDRRGLRPAGHRLLQVQQLFFRCNHSALGTTILL